MKRVLLIVPDPDLTKLIDVHLRTFGYDVCTARRGDEGLEKALTLKPDLIVMDGIMPDATGFQMSNKFRRNAGTQAIPIVLMSGIAHYPNQQQFAMERGVNEYISKPLKLIELGEIVDRYIKPLEEETIALPMEMESTWTPQKESQFNWLDAVHNALNPHLKKASSGD